MRDLGIGSESKSVVTPGTSTVEGGDVQEKEQGAYRAAAARGNYLAQDRVDVQFAAKEISRFMPKPEKEDRLRAKRLARYLKGSERVVVKFGFQQMPTEIVVWSDTDFAGCRRARRSVPARPPQAGVCDAVEHWPLRVER